MKKFHKLFKLNVKKFHKMLLIICEISWSSIKGMRNRIVHDYGYVDMSIVYNAVTVFIPEMYEILKR